MSHHPEDLGVVDDAFGHGDPDVGRGLVILGSQLELEARRCERCLRFLDGKLRPQLDHLAQRRLGPRERTRGGDLDRLLGGAHCEGQESRQQ